MPFYNLDKKDRQTLVEKMNQGIVHSLSSGDDSPLIGYFSDDDTYIRKNAYLIIGKIYNKEPNLQKPILKRLLDLYKSNDAKVRQTVVNAAGEIGMKQFEAVQHFFDQGLFDEHHSVRNAVIGSVKKMGDKNPKPVLAWAKMYLHHEDKEIRREICHGIELRGRKHPEDILPLLKELQFDKTARVKNTLIHVIGQIAYKKGCLEKVVAEIITWENKELVEKSLAEIIDVHHRYRDFSHYSQADCIRYLDSALNGRFKIKLKQIKQ